MSIRRVPPREASELVSQGYTYVDVRSVPEYEEAHAPGALNLPLMHKGPGGMSPNPEFAAAFQRKFPAKDAQIVLGCRSGGRSLRAAELLAGLGYTGLVDMRGGWDGERDATGRAVVPGWADEGLPSEPGSPPGLGWASLK